MALVALVLRFVFAAVRRHSGTKAPSWTDDLSTLLAAFWRKTLAVCGNGIGVRLLSENADGRAWRVLRKAQRIDPKNGAVLGPRSAVNAPIARRVLNDLAAAGSP